MNIIIFGGTGFFGKSLLSKIKGHAITLVSRKKLNGNNKFNNLLYDNISNKKNLNSIESYDLAIDFSSSVSVDDFIKCPEQLFLKNVEIPIKNLKFLANIGFNGKYLFITTDRAIGIVDGIKLISKFRIKNDPYGASKMIGELIVKYACGLNWEGASTLRFPNLYGPGQKSMQLIPSIISKLKEGQLDIELASLNGHRNYIYIDDAVDALLRYIQYQSLLEDFCISGENVKIKNIAEYICKFYKKYKNKNITFYEKEGRSKRLDFQLPPDTMDDSKFRKIYNWKPKVSMETGIGYTINKEL